MTRTIYFERKILVQTILCVPIFLAMLAAFLGMFFMQPAPGSEAYQPAILAFAALPIALLALCLHSIWSYFANRIELGEQAIRVRLPLRDFQFGLNDIDQLKWRLWPAGGSVRIHSGTQKVSLGFEGYATADRLAIATALQRAVPSERQVGWPEFCHQFALRWHDRQFAEVVTHSTPLEQGQVAITRQRYDRMLKWMLPVSLFPAIALGPWTRWASLFGFPAMALASWLMLRLSTPKRGYIAESLSRERELLWLPIMLVFLLPALALTRFAEYLGMDKSFTDAAFVGICLSWVPLMFFFGHRADKARKQRLILEYPKSTARWESILAASPPAGDFQ